MRKWFAGSKTCFVDTPSEIKHTRAFTQMSTS